jgi:chromate transport protein ChrA
MILIIEILFLLAGLYALFTAKMPSWIVGKGYKAEGNQVRLIGGLMAALLPGVLCLGFTLGFVGAFAEFDPTGWITFVEIAIVILVAIIVTVMLRKVRVPDVPPAQTNYMNIEPK